MDLGKLLQLRKEVHSITESNLRINRHANMTEVASDIEWMFNFDLRGHKSHILITLPAAGNKAVIKIGGDTYYDEPTICKRLVKELWEHDIYIEQEYMNKYA